MSEKNERNDLIMGVYKSSEGYGRGLGHADQLFEAGQSFDYGVVGSERVRILDGHFKYEVIVEGEAGEPVSKLLSLAQEIQTREVLGAIPWEMNQFDYRGHLVGFSDRYNALLVEKHAETLDRLGITGTMGAVNS